MFYITCWFSVLTVGSMLTFVLMTLFLVVYIFYDMVVSLICWYAICSMLYYVSKMCLNIYISCLNMSHWILHVHKLSIVGRLATLK